MRKFPGRGLKGGRSPTEGPRPGKSRPAAPPGAADRLVIATDRVSVWVLSSRIRPLPGRHVTDHQMRLYMKFRQTEATPVAAAKASFSAATAYRIEQDHKL